MSKKPLKVRYHFSLVFFAAIVIFGLFFYRYMKTSTLEDVLSQDRSIVVPALSDNIDEKTNGGNDDAASDKPDDAEPGEIINPVPESAAKDKEYLNSCVFIGDSLTFGLASYEVVPASSVYASVSMNISKIETEIIDTPYGRMNVIDALKESAPENIYIMLGSNGAAWMSVSDMYQSFRSFADRVKVLCPDSHIYIISVPPVTSEKETSKESPVLNADLDRFNERLLEYANTNQMHYLDLNAYLKNDSGVLPKGDAENDGVHFKYSTYEKFVDYILSHTVS